MTPSLVFQDVVYVDSLSNIEKVYTDSDLIQYIIEHSEYRAKPRLVFHQADYTAQFGEDKASFDLLISLSSGLVSQACGSYLKKGGLLFVNNEHYDASMAYVDPQFELIGVFKTANSYIESKQSIHRFFLTSKGQRITSEMVKQDLKRSPSKARYKLAKKAPFYLFQLLASFEVTINKKM